MSIVASHHRSSGGTYGLVADKGYSSRANRNLLTSRGIKVTIPEKDDQLVHRRRRGSRGGRPYAFDPTFYRCRNVVERGFHRYKHWRGLASRYDKTALNYLNGLTLASCSYGSAHDHPGDTT